MTGYVYETCCVNSTGPLINAMTAGAHEISRATFIRAVDRDSRRDIETLLGYELDARRGLTMARDWAVAYYRSTYDGRPCVYFVWSAIEHIFTARYGA